MPQMYAHILHFHCPDCSLPLSTFKVIDERNLETIDGQAHNVTCPDCRSHFDLLGATAKSHAVEPWQEFAHSPRVRAVTQPGSW
jgi:rubredoxin